MKASHILRESLESAGLVTEVMSDERRATITWHDGHQSVFHTIWLRDNCSCDSCGDHSGGHRFFELNMMPGDLANRISFDGNLIKIDWLKEAHSTVFDAAWLRSHCYSNQERARRRHKPVLWDAGLTECLPHVSYPAALEDQEHLLAIYDAVRTYGICLLEDVPKRPEETEEIAGLLSFVRETHYGRVFEIVSMANPAVIANIPVPLRPHTDENFREPPPGIMIFHSIKASEDGGGKSVMTDGFRLAADFKA